MTRSDLPSERTWRQEGKAWVLDNDEQRWAYVGPFGGKWDVKVFYEGADRHSYHYRMGLELEAAKGHAEAVLAEYAPETGG